MSHLLAKNRNTRLTAKKIVLIYFAVGSAWILCSSLWLSQWNPEPSAILSVEVFKGLGFVIATAILLWFLCRSWSRQVAEALSRHQESEQKLLMLNAMLCAIRRVNKSIVGTKEVGPLIRNICNILIQDREFKHAWIVLLDEEGQALHDCDAPEREGSDAIKDYLLSGKFKQCIERRPKKDRLILAPDPIEECPGFPQIKGLENCALLGIEFSYDRKLGYIILLANHAVIENVEELDLFKEVAEDLRFALQSIEAESERKRANEDLLIAKQAAEKANRAKDEFLSVMSHELRTPLNPIMGHTSLLMEEIEGAEYLESLEEIYQSSGKLLRLINDILFFSHLQEGAESYQSTHFPLLETCEASLNTCRSQYPNQRIQLENGTKDYQAIEAETLVCGVVEYLQRILDGLLSNACTYTHEGDIYLRLGQRETKSGKLETIFEVEDSGIGIEKEVLEKLFDPFTQLDSSNTRRYRGVGLGLAICRKIADVMGGTLTAQSQPGVGSCFRFCCFWEQVPVQNEPESASPLHPASQASALGRILLVEDNPSNARIAQTMMRRWGLTIDWAEHGQSAIEMCEANSYELILMDLSMPIMDGFNATQKIRNSETSNRETPIVGLTAHVSQDVENACYKVGMNGFIAKPIWPETFKNCISEHVQLSGQVVPKSK